MGNFFRQIHTKSAKKSASKVATAAVVAAPAPAKPLKKRKRELEVVVEKELVSAKKQKANAPAKNGKVDSDSDSDSSGVAPAKATKAAAPDSDDCDETSDEEVMAPAKKAAPVAAPKAAAKKPESSSDESSSGDEAPGDEAPAPVAKKATAPAKQKAQMIDSSDEEVAVPAAKKDVSSSDSDEEVAAPAARKADSDDDEAPEAAIKSSAAVPKKAESSEEPQKKKIKAPDADVEDAKTPQTPVTPSTDDESKTLFIDNLSLLADDYDIEKFFEPIGKVDVHFSQCCQVAFATPEQATEALLLMNGEKMLEREVRISRAGGWNDSPFEREPKIEVLVKGFDSKGEDMVHSLENHFKSCGEIARITIPRDKDGGTKGLALVQFLNDDSRIKALKLHGSRFGIDNFLSVEDLRPRRDLSWIGGTGGCGFNYTPNFAVATGKKTTFCDEE